MILAIVQHTPLRVWVMLAGLVALEIRRASCRERVCNGV